MPRWILVPVVVIGGLAAAGTVAVMAGRSAWQRETDRAVAQLRAGDGERAERLESQATEFMSNAQQPVPAPVARYLALVLPEGQPPVRAARIRWRGEFQSRPGGGWAPLTAEQHFTTRPPGFVWDAEIRMLPLVPVKIRDSYLDRGAAMHGRIGGVVPIVAEGGTPEIAQSALARWLGEAVWFPTALLPGAAGGGVRWEAIDDSTARAIITDGSITASAEFHFAPSGEITKMTALRYRDVAGTQVLTPFEGEYHDYTLRDGVLVPTRAEVAWLLPEGRYPYWRAGPETIEYERVKPPAEAGR